MTPLWLVFITIIVFALLVIAVKISIGGFETFISENTGLLYISTSFNSYIDSIHSNMYPVKIRGCSKNMSKQDFRKLYQSYLVSVPNSKIEFLRNYTRHIDSMLINYPAVKNIKWRFIVSKSGLELDMPFTLADYIVLPEHLLNRLNNNIDNSIATTLLHEKIHILQRYNQEQFTKFYISNTSLPSVKVYYGHIPENISRINMTNPDSNGIYYLYRQTGISYLPLLVYLDGRLVQKAYNTIGFSNYTSIDTLVNGYNQGLYHPNEIIAYKLSKSIIEKKPIDLELANFIKMLS